MLDNKENNYTNNSDDDYLAREDFAAHQGQENNSNKNNNSEKQHEIAKELEQPQKQENLGQKIAPTHDLASTLDETEVQNDNVGDRSEGIFKRQVKHLRTLAAFIFGHKNSAQIRDEALLDALEIGGALSKSGTTFRSSANVSQLGKLVANAPAKDKDSQGKSV